MKKLVVEEKFKSACPKLSDEEFKRLEDLIIKDGIIYNPILVWDDVIIDGHNRYEIAVRHNIDFTIKEITFEFDEEAIAWIKENAISQRNLNDYQRSKLVLELADYYKDKAKGNLKLSKGQGIKGSPILADLKIDVREELSKKAGVSHGTIDKVKYIEYNADDEVKDELEKGEKSISKAYNEVKETKVEIAPEVDILESAAASLERWVNKNSDKESMFEFIPIASLLVKKIRDKKVSYG